MDKNDGICFPSCLPPPAVGRRSDGRRHSLRVIHCRAAVDEDLSCPTNGISGIYMTCITRIHVICYTPFKELIITPSRTSKKRLYVLTVTKLSPHASTNVSNQNPSQQANKPSTPLIAYQPPSSAKPRTSRTVFPNGLFLGHHLYRSTIDHTSASH